MTKKSRKSTVRTFLKTGALCALGLAGLRVFPSTAGAQTARMGLVKARPSPWFTPLEGGNARCDLCPRRCRLANGERGPCQVRENRNGIGHTLVYGNPVMLQMDPVERNPFFHFLPGSRALSVSTAGCNMACRFCEVWDMALVAPEEVHAYDVPPADVVAKAMQSDARAISFSFGEPVVFFEYMKSIAGHAREAGLLTLLHTNGYIAEAPLRALTGWLDSVNIDLKSFNPDFYRDVCGGELEPVLATLRILKNANVPIEITHPVIPSLNDDPDFFRQMCRWIVDHLGKEIPLHLVRFYPLYKLANLPPTPVRTLDRAREAARREGLEYVYIGRVTGHEGESTFCPRCGEAVIRRLGFFVEAVQLKDGECARCGNPIPGRWS